MVSQKCAFMLHHHNLVLLNARHSFASTAEMAKCAVQKVTPEPEFSLDISHSPDVSYLKTSYNKCCFILWIWLNEFESLKNSLGILVNSFRVLKHFYFYTQKEILPDYLQIKKPFQSSRLKAEKYLCFSKTWEPFNMKLVLKIVYIRHRVYSSHPCFKRARWPSIRWFMDLRRISDTYDGREFGFFLQMVKSMQIWVRGNSHWN